MPKPSPTSAAARAAFVLRLGIVLATVWLLASAAQQMLSGPGHRGAPSTFVIQIQETPSGETAADPSTLWIDQLIVDGQPLRLDSLERTGAWEIKAWRGAGSPLNLLLPRSPQQAGVTFQGKRFLMVAKTERWSGEIRLQRNGDPARTVAVESQGGEQYVAVEDPVAPASTTVFVVALLVFGAAAWGLAPIRGSRGSATWLIFFLSVFHLLFWAGQYVGTMPDSVGYLVGIKELREGYPSYFPPGYTALLAAVGSFSGQHLGSWITLIQHAMAVLAGLWIYRLLGRLIPEEPALLGGLLTGALVPVLAMSQSVMSEIPTLFSMVGALYFAVRSAETKRRLPAILAGVLTGWAAVMRVVPLAALLPAIFLVLLLPFSKRGLGLAGLTLAATAAVVLLPLSWFWFHSGELRLANSSGKHLYNRIVMEQKQFDERGPASRTLLALVEGNDPRGVYHWIIASYPGMSQLGYAKGESLLRAVAIEALRKDPLAYLSFTPRLAWRDFVADAAGYVSPWGSTLPPNPRLERAPALTLTAACLNWRWRMEYGHHPIWLVLCGASIAGVLVGMWLPRRTLVLALAWIPTTYLLGTASVEAFDMRYNVGTIPFVAALAMLPLGLLFSAAFSPRRQVDPALKGVA